MSHIFTTPNQMKQLLFSKDATGRRASNGGPSKNIGKKEKKKKGNEGPNSLVTQRNTMFFLTVKHNEHFHHFPALLLSGSVGVLLFACYSGSTGILTHVPPHHGLHNKDKESRGVITTGRQALLCLRFELKADFEKQMNLNARM